MDSKTVEKEKPSFQHPTEDRWLARKRKSLTSEKCSLYDGIVISRTEKQLAKTGERTYSVPKRQELIEIIDSGTPEEVEELENELAQARESKRKEAEEKKKEEIGFEEDSPKTPPTPDKLTKHKLPDEDYVLPYGGLPVKDRD